MKILLLGRNLDFQRAGSHIANCGRNFLDDFGKLLSFSGGAIVHLKAIGSDAHHIEHLSEIIDIDQCKPVSRLVLTFTLISADYYDGISALPKSTQD